MLNPFSSVRLHGTYKLFPAFVRYRDQVDLVVTITRIYRDSGNNEMVKYEPGTYTGNAYGYEKIDRFNAMFYRVGSEGEEMNNDALTVIENQRLEIHRALLNAISKRRTLHWDLEQNRREITKNQELLRVNKIARQAIQEDKP